MRGHRRGAPTFQSDWTGELAENDPDPVALLIISERDSRLAVVRLAIDLNGRHPPSHTLRVLDSDVVPRRVIAERDVEALPRTRDTRIDHEPRATQPESENPLEAGSIHPSGGPRVPRPAPAADVRGFGIDVPGEDVGLDLVAVNAGWRAGVVDRVQDR